MTSCMSSASSPKKNKSYTLKQGDTNIDSEHKLAIVYYHCNLLKNKILIKTDNPKFICLKFINNNVLLLLYEMIINILSNIITKK